MQIPEQYIKAGKIAREVRKWVTGVVKPGVKINELCEEVEKKIIELGGSPAFPCGIGINSVTAHYSPQANDNTVITEADVVKIDFGVHVDGYIADTATTVTFNEKYSKLVNATERALNESIEVARRDQRAGEIGRAISNVARESGFRVIENLTGHTLDRFVVHAGKSIPNLFMPNLPMIRKDEIFAIEPFLTVSDASGYVVDSSRVTIYSIIARKRTELSEANSFLDAVWNERRTLPFTPRWYGEIKNLDYIVNYLVKKKVLRAYPELVERYGKPVAQFEHTLAFDNGSLIVLT